MGIIYSKKTYEFRTTLMEKLVDMRMDPHITDVDFAIEMEMPSLPKNLGSIHTPKPSKEDVVASHRSRFTEKQSSFEVTFDD